MSDGYPLGIYLHVPFCRTRCEYCDFAILTGQFKRVDEYFAGLQSEISSFARRNGQLKADTLYFGGGTPSAVPPASLAAVVEHLAGLFQLAADTEISIEANPEDVTTETAAAWRAGGISRITLGIQSMSLEGLGRLGRPGEAGQARRAVELLREAGIPAIGADMIFGSPGQVSSAWREDLEKVLELPLDHLSCYALETTSNTPLVRSIQRQERPNPDADLAAELYEWTCQRLVSDGWDHYEISNFARPGARSRHNLKYWQDADYVGFGLSAASYFGGERWINPRGYAAYLRAAQEIGDPPEREPYQNSLRGGEAMVFGLRRLEGIDLETIAERHGAEVIEDRWPAIQRAVRDDLALLEGRQLRLTPRGLLLAHEFFVDLL